MRVVETDFITMSDDAVVRRNIQKPYEDIDELAPKSVKDQFKATNYIVSSDAKFIAYRSNYQKVLTQLQPDASDT